MKTNTKKEIKEVVEKKVDENQLEKAKQNGFKIIRKIPKYYNNNDAYFMKRVIK